MEQKAFTLAEVLITLVIIGVIAALTIPTIIANKEKQETISKLKKVYSTFASALERSQVENGNISTWTYSTAWLIGLADYNTYFKPYLKTTKECGVHWDNQSKPCWPSKPKSRLDGGVRATNDQVFSFILSDGTFVALSRGFDYINDPAFYVYLIQVDINGDKGPNVWGNDAFMIGIYPIKGLRPYAYNDTRATNMNNCNTKAIAWQCLAPIVQDNWQILDDYNW